MLVRSKFEFSPRFSAIREWPAKRLWGYFGQAQTRHWQQPRLAAMGIEVGEQKSSFVQ
jgi:hypothetical protein